MASLRSRIFAEGDSEELNALYNLVAGRSRTINQFRWEWLDNPEGWGSMWLIEDTNAGKIIGHHGLIPIRLSYFGESALAGKTENTVMHPQYRGKGIYTPFEAKFVQEAKDRFKLLFTTSGILEQGRVRLKLGYSIIGEYITYVKILKKSYLDGVLAGAIRNKPILLTLKVLDIVPFGLIKLFFRRGPIDKKVELQKIENIDTIADRIDGFWEENKDKFGITPDRNSRYLKWRIFDNPNVSYDFLLGTRESKIVGYVVTQLTNEKKGLIIDLVDSGNDEIVFNSILTGAANHLRDKGADVVQFRTLYSINSLNKRLKKNGFLSSTTLSRLFGKRVAATSEPLMAKALDSNLSQEKISEPANWYFTSILFEGIS